MPDRIIEARRISDDSLVDSITIKDEAVTQIDVEQSLDLSSAGGDVRFRMRTPDTQSHTPAITLPPPPPVPDQITEIRISASADDVEQAESGALYLNSTDLELVDDGSWRPNQTIGLRFNGLDIPQGAVITAANVQFQVDEGNSGTSVLLIRGEDTDSAAAFTNTAYNVSTRQLTDATVEWSPSEWASRGEAGTAQQTADISPIIQEIVNRDGWVAMNSLVLVISGEGERTAVSYDGDQSAAPLLRVVWSPQSSGTS